MPLLPISDDADSYGIDKIVRLITKFGKASYVLAAGELNEVHRLVECSKVFLADKAKSWIRLHREEPLFMSRSGDGTPMKTRERFTVGKGDSHIRGVICSARELLLQRVFVKNMKGETLVVMAEPRGMTQGKETWVMFSAQRQLFGTLRESGHVGPHVSHYVYDRGVHDAMMWKNRALHNMAAHEVAGGRFQPSRRCFS